MRRFLSSKLTIVALILVVATLITGVALAATSNQGLSEPGVVEIVPIPMFAPEGTALQVAGAGFTPGDTVLFEIVLNVDSPNLILQGGDSNDAGAFLADTTRGLAGGVLPAALSPGLYTVLARTVDGIVATSPLIVCKPELEEGSTDPKCPIGATSQ